MGKVFFSDICSNSFNFIGGRMSDEMTQTTETTATETEPQAPAVVAESQPEEPAAAVGNDDLLTFLNDAQEKQQAERTAREAAKKAAAAAQKPTLTQTQPMMRSEPLIAAEAHGEITFLKEVVEPKLRGLDAASLNKLEEMLRKRWENVSMVVLGECIKYRVEYYLSRAKEAKRVPDPVASMLLHWGFARTTDRETHEASIEAWKRFGNHKRETREDRNHNRTGDCKACTLPSFTSWEALDGTLFAVDLKNGGDKGSYARQISRKLDDWRRASSSARGAVAEACHNVGAEPPNSPITFDSMASGDEAALGKTIAIVVPRELAIFHRFTDRETGEEKSIPYRGVFFVHMLSVEEQARYGVRVPKGWVAIGLDAPSVDEDAGKLEKPLRDVLGDKKEPKIFLFNASDPIKRPFDMLQDSRSRMTPKINWGTMKLQDFLVRFLRSGGERTATAEEPISGHVMRAVDTLPQPVPERRKEKKEDEHGDNTEKHPRAGKPAVRKEKGGGNAQRWVS